MHDLFIYDAAILGCVSRSFRLMGGNSLGAAYVVLNFLRTLPAACMLTKV